MAAKVAKPEARAGWERSAAKISGPQNDAWGRELLVHLDDQTRTATFVSVGPDGNKGNNDDVICVASGVREWDSGRDEVRWNYVKSWTLPEGLEAAVKPLLPEQGRGKVQYTCVVD